MRASRFIAWLVLTCAVAVGAEARTGDAQSFRVAFPHFRTAATKVWQAVAAPPVAAAALPATSVDMKVLVLSADGTEVTLPAIQRALARLGVSYDVYVARQSPGGLTAARLSAGTRGLYQGVILATGDLGYFDGTAWRGALTGPEWQALWAFEAQFRVRQVTWYAYPHEALGFAAGVTATDTAASPLAATYTAAGKSVFSYANTGRPLPIAGAWTYLAHAAKDGRSQPLLTDGKGDALALVRSYADGREDLVLTFDSNEYLTHGLVLSHGLVRWVTRGLFVGERHAYLAPQLDDLFLDSDIWPSTGATYRINGPDVRAAVRWQAARRAQAISKTLRLAFAFNGEGATGTYTAPAVDTLVRVMRDQGASFEFINHTFTHSELNDLDYVTVSHELAYNDSMALALGFRVYDRRSLVTPGISGLLNPAAMQAAFDAGVRFVVTDTSQPGYDNPSPNAGIANPLQPLILMIPRRPTNLFYNVSTPAEWTSEYNALYRDYWGRDLAYSEVLDRESELLLSYLLKGDLDPLMFHQANLRAYDGTHSVLGDLLDTALARYARLVQVPALSLAMHEIGARMRDRMDRDAGGVTATLTPATARTAARITLVAQRACVVPVTGLNTGKSASTTTESYAGDAITYVTLSAGQSVTLNVR